VGPGGGTPGTASNFELVGHNPLFARGMNAALTVYDHYVYVGNRTDGQSKHPNPGILIVDIADPANPTVVGEIGPPHAAQIGITTRELRVWPEKKLLIVMTFRCSAAIHDCPPGNDTTFPFDIKFFDLSDPLNPQFIARHVTRSSAGTAVKPHEFYLWIDPTDADRALIWESTPTTSVNPARPNLVIEDISAVPAGGPVRLVAEGNWNQFFPGAGNAANYDFDLALHSMTPSPDGKRTYLAYLRGGFGVVDTSKVAAGKVPTGTVESLNDDLLTDVPLPTWGTGPRCPGGTAEGCAESHSAVPLPGRPFALTIDEVYGTFTVPSFGWPWGWARTWNVAQPRRPRMLGEYKILQNTPAYTPAPGENEFNSYSSHNPTPTRNLVLDAWHSGGLQAIDVEDPGRPSQAGWFSPEPLAEVATEDPALSRGPNKVVMWSFPIVRNGLIYVVDIRNGLYVLRYTGPH
ncbi:MAG: hypothetical protein M3168_05415, partial [Actinomycetota bacterium]|nr:hypothetical protein [Actinomycetota bacterium]